MFFEYAHILTSSGLHRFWYVKLQALTAIRDFEGLETFAKSKRSPIGYDAFVKHLVDKGHSKEALAYVPRCDGPKRADLYVLCDDWRAAAKECKDRGDKAKLECVFPLSAYHYRPPANATSRQLRKSCPNSLIARELEQTAASMR